MATVNSTKCNVTVLPEEKVKKNVRISYTNKATIPAQERYSNQSPSYTITLDLNDVTSPQEVINQELSWIKTYIDNKIRDDFILLTNFSPAENGDKNLDISKIGLPDKVQVGDFRIHKQNGRLYKRVISDEGKEHWLCYNDVPKELLDKLNA